MARNEEKEDFYTDGKVEIVFKGDVDRVAMQELKTTRAPAISVQEAAQIMGVTPRFLQMGLQQDKFPFGAAVKMKRWSYYINTERFLRYLRGKEETA